MFNKLKRTETQFAYFLLLFIALQPVLDLLTSLSIQMLNVSATAGIVVRLAVMLLATIYFFLQWQDRSLKKWIVYTLILGATIAAGLINNMIIKDPFSFTEEVKFIAKSVYTIMMLFAYIFVFKTIPNKDEAYHKMLKYFLYASLFISFVMLISIVTGTDYKSYPHSKLGSRGWFFSGNELGAILAISFPVVVLYGIHKTTSFKKVYYWIPTILAMYASLMIGTKVGYGAVILTLGVALFFSFIEYIMNRKKEGKGYVQLVNTIVSLVMFGGLIALTPLTPIAKNMGIHLQIYEYKKSVREEQAKKDGKPIEEDPEEEEKIENGELTKGEVKSLIYSDRDRFLQVHKQYYEEAPVSQKLLGMGYASNYTKTPKMVEMDFHDLFFSYGAIGFFVYLLPFLYFAIRLLIRVFTNFTAILNAKYMLLASSLALAFGIGLTAGHVLTAPAVSIFFVVVLAYLIVDLKAE
ncbi:membrane protein [Bacillus manliponensis]|uniref:Membrane protein n=1 Tax=Bacillus manliponensis TaxID=574376 RepID=A0A073JVV7_9BACI|nr:O-antigen ligase family protein [Bacillus manliponensis]KEK19149.1 membrane protein [Bacillus manliponensis]